MATRASMTMRAQIQRDEAAVDDFGGEATPDWTNIGFKVACRVWMASGRESIDGTKTAVVEDRRAVFPIGTDIREGDRLEAVEDRRGNVLFAGPIGIESVGRRADHLAVRLEAVGSYEGAAS